MRHLTLSAVLLSALTVTSCGDNPLTQTSGPSAIIPPAARLADKTAASADNIMWGEKLPGEKVGADNIMWGESVPVSKPAFDLWDQEDNNRNEY